MDKLRELLARQRELVDTIEAEQRELNEEELKEFNSISEQIRELRKQQEENDPKTDDPEKDPEGDDSDDDEDEDKKERALISAERARVREIMTLCEGTSLNARDLIANGTSVARVRYLANEALIEEKAPIPQGQGVIEDAGDKLKRNIADAILARGGVIDPDTLGEGAQRYMYGTTRDMFIDAYIAEGVSRSEARSMKPKQIVRRFVAQALAEPTTRAYMQPSALFPAIMDTVAEKSIVAGYESVDLHYTEFTSKTSVKDFKSTRHRYMAGGASRFERLPEGGEMKEDRIETELLPEVSIQTWAKRWSLTRETIINDDIGMAAAAIKEFGAQYKETINDEVYKVLINNPTIYDGKPLFTGRSAGHGNLISEGTQINGDALQGMINALNDQTDYWGKLIKQRPGVLLVPSGVENDLTVLLDSPTINTKDNTQAKNPWFNFGVRVIRDASINMFCGGSGNVMPWFLFAAGPSPIVITYLNGSEKLESDVFRVPDQLGIVYNWYGDFGVNPVDYRQIVKNNGYKIESAVKVDD